MLGASPEKIRDETGERIREEFYLFLQRYRPSNEALQNPIPTSEMLTASTPNSAYSEPPSLGMNASLQHPYELRFYVQQLHEMRNDGQTTMYVDFNHVLRYDEVLAVAIVEHFYRMEPFLKEALRMLVEAYLPSYTRSEPNGGKYRDFWVSFYNLQAGCRIRELTTQRIGHLMAISGTVTRTSEVRPELLFGTFRCDACFTTVREVEQQFRYTEPTVCPSPQCLNRHKWTLLPEASTFVNWQRLRVQENADEIPPGSLPRTLDVILRNDLVERAKAGDRCTFTGCLIVVPDYAALGLPGSRMETMGDAVGRSNANDNGITGLKALGVRDLTYRLAVMACMVQRVGQQGIVDDLEVDLEAEDFDPRTIFTAQELDDIRKMRQTPQLYHRLVQSVAPSIYGHSEIKAGILLMLFGGVHKVE